jgi:hypothetical protein
MVLRLLRHFLSIVASAPVVLAALSSPVSAAAGDIMMAPHRAVYDMSLAAAR